MKRFVLVGLLAAGCAGGFAAESGVVRTLTLSQCVQMAIEHGLDVRIERYGPQIAEFNLKSSYGAYDPAFVMGVTHAYKSGGDGSSVKSTADIIDPAGIRGMLPSGMTYDVGGNFKHSWEPNVAPPRTIKSDWYSGGLGIALKQPLLKDFQIDQPRLNIRVAKKALKISELGFSGIIMTIATSVERAYYDLVFARENIKVQKKAYQLAQKLLEENKKRVEVGALAPLDEKQAESQVAARKADLLVARQDFATKQNVLKGLLVDNYAEWHAVEIEPVDKLLVMPEKFDIQESWRRSLAQRPDLLQARQDLERQDIVLKYHRNQLLPSLDLSATYGHNAFDKSLGDAFVDPLVRRHPYYSLGVEVSIPLSRRGVKNKLEAAKAEKAQAVLKLKKQEQDILVEVDNAIKQAQTSLERIESTRQARLYAEAALDAEQKKLENGKSTSFFVLQLQKDLTTACTAEISAQTDYNKALAQIALAEGSTLERHHLNVNAK